MTDSLNFNAIRLVWAHPAPPAQTAAEEAYYPLKGLFGFMDRIDRPITAEDVFGPQTQLVAEVGCQPPALPLQSGHLETSSPFFQGFVLLIAVFFVMLAANRRQEIGLLVADSSTDERLYENRKNVAGLLGFLIIAGWMSVVVVVIRWLAETDGWAMDMAWKIPLAVAAVSLAGIYKWLVLNISGRLVLQDELTHKLILLHALLMGRIALYGLPFALFYALSPSGEGQWWLRLWGIVCIYRSVLFVGKSLSLFLIKKISILHWILYLCTVEVFPVTLLILLVNRY